MDPARELRRPLRASLRKEKSMILIFIRPTQVMIPWPNLAQSCLQLRNLNLVTFRYRFVKHTAFVGFLLESCCMPLFYSYCMLRIVIRSSSVLRAVVQAI